ncbi:MAG: efflux RND transporter periplasmic adaptor subunit [Gemmatimonadales bacterium]|nr:MAG: efflux RND transporter periplasmic adaptor subunit [Gemmatimonadales bacterium]
MNRTTQLVASVLLVAGAGIVVLVLSRGGGPPVEDAMEGHDHAAMLAGMDEAQPVRLTEADARRIGVALARAEEKRLSFSVEAVGVATYDETRLRVVNPKVEGWVEHLYVDFNGAPVREGDPLMEIYAPQLVSAQEELALAARLVEEAGSERARANAESLLESARRRLAYWDIPEEVVARVEGTGEVQRTVTLAAPATGIVVEKAIVEGDRIMPGMTLYRIADLSQIWVEVDVFERELGLVREGQEAEVRFQAFPDDVFAARVTYIYPTVSLESRTGRVRLELANPRGRLRPGMYAEVTLTTQTGDLAVVVPRSALLETGERALVFVDAADGTLVPRAVTPGRVSGREVEILAGLSPGERIVTSAAFLVDAESNLGALMEMEEAGAMDSMDAGMGEMDHSQHDMGAMDTMDASGGAMDHSQHDMGAADTMEASDGAMDHSQHDMNAADTTGGGSSATDHSGMDHSQHRASPDTSSGSGG